MTFESSKAAEELFHRTIKTFTTDPLEDMSQEMKSKMTPVSLFCMQMSGVSYFLAVGISVFVASMCYSLPVVCQDDDSLFTHRLITMYIMLNIVSNFLLVLSKRSFYKGNYKNDKNDINKNTCLDCQHDIPPGVHHCALCRHCIVKRDHHCFFTGCCIGFENHRYFLVYCFYNAAGCIYLLYFAWHYLVITHGHPSTYGYSHLILPIALVEWLLGYCSASYVGAVLLVCACVLTALGSSFIFTWQFFLAVYGSTTYEFWLKGGFSSVKPLQIAIGRNLYAVFGRFWLLNFFFPMVWVKQPGNGLEVNVYKQI